MGQLVHFLIFVAIIIVVLFILLVVKLVRYKFVGETEFELELFKIFKIHFKHNGKK